MLQKNYINHLLLILICSLSSSSLFAADDSQKNMIESERARIARSERLSLLALATVAPLGTAVALTYYYLSGQDTTPKQLPQIQNMESICRTQAEQEMHDAIKVARAETELQKNRTKLAQNQTKAVEAENNLREARLRLEQNNRELEIVTAQKAFESCIAMHRTSQEKNPSGLPTACDESGYILTMAAGSRERLDKVAKLFKDLQDHK